MVRESVVRGPCENEVWILDELFEYAGSAMHLFCPCCVEEHANREAPWAGTNIDVPRDAFASLRDREWVEFSRDGKVLQLSRAGIRDAISVRPCPRCDGFRRSTYVGLTPLGVAAWEAEFRPDWDRYVDVAEVRRRDGWFHLRARRRDVLERVLLDLPHVGVAVIPGSVKWHAPLAHRAARGPLRWREPEPLIGVSIGTFGRSMRYDDPVSALWFDVEAACPRWCSPFSQYSRWRGVTASADR